MVVCVCVLIRFVCFFCLKRNLKQNVEVKKLRKKKHSKKNTMSFFNENTLAEKTQQTKDTPFKKKDDDDDAKMIEK